MNLIAPSLLSADFLHLEDDIEMINRSEADWFHCDVMDGRFVPNISFGIPVVQAIKKKAQKPLDVHLMIVEPEKYFEAFAKVGADIITFHYEACTHIHRAVQQIKALGVKAGVVLNPHTPVSVQCVGGHPRRPGRGAAHVGQPGLRRTTIHRAHIRKNTEAAFND